MSSRPEPTEIILTELELLQARFLKYDELVYKSRGWALTLSLGLVTVETGLRPPVNTSILNLAALAVILFWLEEGLVRFSHVFKYASRYRRLRDYLNGEGPREAPPLFDMTNHIEGRGNVGRRLYFAFVRPRESLFYLALLAVTYFVRF